MVGMSKQDKPQLYAEKTRLSFGRDSSSKPYFILVETEEGREITRFTEDDARHHVKVGWGL